jgi:hypothetical protein
VARARSVLRATNECVLRASRDARSIFGGGPCLFGLASLRGWLAARLIAAARLFGEARLPLCRNASFLLAPLARFLGPASSFLFYRSASFFFGTAPRLLRLAVCLLLGRSTCFLLSSLARLIGLALGLPLRCCASFLLRAPARFFRTALCLLLCCETRLLLNSAARVFDTTLRFSLRADARLLHSVAASLDPVRYLALGAESVVVRATTAPGVHHDQRDPNRERETDSADDAEYVHSR